MTAASARVALIGLASSWRAQGMLATQVGNTHGALVYVACATRLDETTITHLTSSVRDDQWASTQLGRAVEAFTWRAGIDGNGDSDGKRQRQRR